MKRLLMTMACAVGCTLIASGAFAQQQIDLTVAAGQPLRAMKPLNLVHTYFIPEVNKRIKAAGLDKKFKINWKEAYAGSLLKPTRVFQGVSDGIADIGFSPTIFHPDRLPLEQITFVTPFVTSDVVLVGKVMDEMHAKFPQFAAEYNKYGLIRLAGSSYDSYELFATKPIKTFAEVKGKKIATAGAALQWLRGTGATPVQSNMTEYYNSAKTGVVDGFIIFPSAIPGMKYPGAAPYVSKIGFGAQYAAALIVNKDVFNKLPPELQKILRAVGKDWTARADKVQLDAGNAGYASVSKYPNGERIIWSNAERKKWADAMPNLAAEWAGRLEKQGVPAKKILAAFMDAMRKAGAKPVRDWDK